MEMSLMLLSGIAWSVVYVELIRHGFKDKTYGMPLFALGLNFAWEAIYTYIDIVHKVHGPIDPQAIVNLVWVLLDIVIVYTFFKYGKERFPKEAHKYFIPFGILAFVTCFALQFAFLFEFETVEIVRASAKYSAFLQNATMSILFLVMLFTRKDTRGQSMSIAVAKWIGTLAPTILFGVVEMFNIYIIITGIVCSIFDILYIVLLHSKKKVEQKNMIK